MAFIKYCNNTTDENNVLKAYTKSITSQHGEDGIIERIFEVIGENNYSKWCVEFGAFDGKHLSNTYNLIVNKGWSGVLIEGNTNKFKKLKMNYADYNNVHAFNCMVGLSSNDNIESILAKTPIPQEFGLCSIDIDSCDYYIWESITQYKPIVVVIEYNPTVPNDIIFILDKDMSVNQGSSLLALIELGKQKGYELVAVTHTNGIFVTTEYYSEFKIKDNDINKMRKDSGKRIGSGYDGTIFTNNFSYLGWKRRPIDPEELQVLPKSERFFGGHIPLKYQPQSQLQAMIPEPPGENIAIHKPAQQSSFLKWSKPDESRKAVNGEKDGKFSFCTNKEINPWWQVDLEEIYTLTEARIYNRLDAGSNRANTLRILLSLDETNWEEVYTHDKSLKIGGVDGKPLIVQLESKTARYVRLQLNEENYLHLDEVEVYGVPVNES